MNETLTRAISGVLYIVILIAAIFISPYTFFTLLFVLGIGCMAELQKLLNLNNYISYLVFIVLFVVLGIYRFNVYVFNLLVVATLLIKVLLVRDLLLTHKISLFKGKKYLITIFYLAASIVFLTAIPFRNGQYVPLILISCFVLMWANDTFAYLVGKNWGKRKLLERISPNKTIEGFMGGMIFSLITSYILYLYTHIFEDYKMWIGLSLLISITGTFGDLIQSKLKRQAHVKDSGKIMPGHGGLLDRLDSILFSSTFIYTYLLIIDYVS